MKEKVDRFFEKVRLWQVQFETSFFLPSLPEPYLIAEEVENSPAYVMDGRKRAAESGGQFVITLQGRGCIKIGGKTFDLSPGKTFLHNHHDPDVCYYYPPDAREPWRFLWMSMEGENICSLINALIRRFGHLYDVPLDGELVQKLFSFQGKKRQIRFLSPMDGATLVLSALHMLCSSGKEGASDRSSALIRNVQNILAVEYRQPLNVGILAQRLNVSREHLSRTFSRETGMTLQKCLTHVRMRAAAELLKQPQLTVKEVALQCGYQEYSVFYRNFSSFFHLSPEAFRAGHH